MSIADALTPGDTVYNLHGQEAEFIAFHAGEYIVQPIWEHPETGEPRFSGDPEKWTRCFKAAPRAVLDSEIAAAEKALEGLRAEVRRLAEEKRDFEKGQKERMAAITRHEKLALLEKFIAGQITHYVEDDWSQIVIIDFKKAVYDDGYHSTNKPLRLLTLFGDSKGELNWRLSRYPDGSGGNSSLVYPCCSYDDAVAKVDEITAAGIEAWRTNPETHGLDKMAASRIKYGLEVPYDVANELARRKEACLVVAFQKALAASEAAGKALNDYREAGKPVPVEEGEPP